MNRFLCIKDKKDGGYMLAIHGFKGTQAFLESPSRQSDKKSCMIFNFNIPVSLTRNKKKE